MVAFGAGLLRALLSRAATALTRLRIASATPLDATCLHAARMPSHPRLTCASPHLITALLFPLCLPLLQAASLFSS